MRARVAAGLLAVALAPAAAIVVLALANPSPGEAPGWERAADLSDPRGEVASAARELPGRGGGELYVAGGFEGLASTSDRVSVYRAPADRWEELPALPAARHHAAAALLGGDLYVSGGASGATSRSPEDAVWVLREGSSAWEEAEPMPEGRYAHRMVAVEGRLIAVGGEGRTSRALLFSERGGWTAGAPMPAPRHHLAAVARDGEVWAIGGRDSDDEPLTAVDVYDPDADEWRPGPELPAPVSAAAEGAIDGDIHLVGGERPALLDGGVIERHLVLPDRAPGWQELHAPPLAVHGAAAGVIGGRLLVAGGASRQGLLSTISWSDYAAWFDPALSATGRRGG